MPTSIKDVKDASGTVIGDTNPLQKDYMSHPVTIDGTGFKARFQAEVVRPGEACPNVGDKYIPDPLVKFDPADAGNVQPTLYQTSVKLQPGVKSGSRAMVMLDVDTTCVACEADKLFIGD